MFSVSQKTNVFSFSYRFQSPCFSYSFTLTTRQGAKVMIDRILMQFWRCPVHHKVVNQGQSHRIGSSNCGQSKASTSCSGLSRCSNQNRLTLLSSDWAQNKDFSSPGSHQVQSAHDEFLMRLRSVLLLVIGEYLHPRWFFQPCEKRHGDQLHPWPPYPLPFPYNLPPAP